MPIETKRTFCRFCHASCAIEVDVEDNRVVGVRGDQADPIFGGYTCVKGRHLGDQHHHPDRLRTALKRRPEGGFEEIPTSRALDEIAERLQAIVAEHGPRSVASYSGTAVYGNAVGLPSARAFHKALGSPSFYTSLTIDQPGKILVPLRHGSWAAGHQPFSTADVSLVIGQNVPVSLLGYPGGPTAVDPIVTVREAKRRGWKLIVIDPRRTEMATSADLFLQVRPGEDPTLLAGLLRVILDEGRHDAEFCAHWVRGLDELHAAVRAFDLDHVAQQTGLDRDDIVLAARMFADGPRGSATCGTGPNMAPHGGLTEHLVTCLNTVCGRYPREGEVLANPGGILGWKKPWAPPKAQAISPIPAALTSGEPARVRGLHALIGEGPTAALPDEILEPGEGQVRALLTVGGNPVLAWPDQVKTVRALESLDLHVVLDPQLSATGRLADYVLPSQLSLERPDVPTSVDRWFDAPYVHYTPAVLEADDELVGEGFLFVELAARMGLELDFPGGRLDLADLPTPDDLLELCYPQIRVPWDDLRATVGGHLRPELAATVLPADPDADGYLDVAPDGVADELTEIRTAEDPYGALAGFDPAVHRYRLTSRRLKGVFNSSGREVAALRAKEGTSYAHVHPDDLAELGVADGELLELASPRGVVRAVAKAAPDVAKGSVSMAHAWGDVPGESGPPADPWTLGDSTNRLIDNASAYDRLTGLPVQSAIPIAVRPAS